MSDNRCLLKSACLHANLYKKLSLSEGQPTCVVSFNECGKIFFDYLDEWYPKVNLLNVIPAQKPEVT